jgi:hypothetical protein
MINLIFLKISHLFVLQESNRAKSIRIVIRESFIVPSDPRNQYILFFIDISFKKIKKSHSLLYVTSTIRNNGYKRDLIVFFLTIIFTTLT